MEINKIDNKTIKLTETYNISQSDLYSYVTETHKMSLWLGNQVEKTSKGFTVQIDLPLHQIRLEATIIKIDPPQRFEFSWESEFIMDRSLIVITLSESEPTTLVVEERGPFDESRWSKAQDIHIDLWKSALEKLKKLLDS